MRLSGLMALAALASMVAGPALAQPRNAAAKLSLNDSGVRAGAHAKKSNKLVGSAAILIGAVAVGGVVAAAVSMSHSDSHPASA